MPTLAVVSVSENLTATECRQLKLIFDTYIDIHGYTVPRSNKDLLYFQEELVLIVGHTDIANNFVSCLAKGQDYVIKKRSLDPSNLHALFQIPAHSDVLVVNDVYINACEVIDELLELNIHPLQYYPYDPNMKTVYCYPGQSSEPRRLDSFSYILTAGEKAQVPVGDGNIIDIGDRRINLATVMDICRKLFKDDALDYEINARYMKRFISMSMAFAKKNHENLFLQAQLESVIANIRHGVLLIDEKNKVLICNKRAEEIFNRNDLLECELHKILPKEFLDLAFVQNFIQLGDDMLFVMKTEMKSPLDEQKRYLISMENLEQIQQIDRQYRKQMGETNKARYYFRDIIFCSAAMQQTIGQAQMFAQSDATVLITGESGTGKELLAQAIHNASSRKKQPFVAINCGALAESLLESELFGYEKGAFTGANKEGRAGLFELAHGGTLFLDEIGDTPKPVQIKLLRAIQEKQVLRVGGRQMIPVDVRIIAATNQNLYLLQQQDLFRKDLFYRLNVLPLHVPPLNQRPQDVEPLFTYFVSFLKKDSMPPIGRDLIRLLELHQWPGNVRELENVAAYYVSIWNVLENPVEKVKELLAQAESQAVDSAQTKTGRPKSETPVKTETSLFQNDADIVNQSIAILEILLGAGRNGRLYSGRSEIQKRLEEQYGIQLSFDQIKTRIGILKKNGYAGARQGKGCFICEEGKAFLENIQAP